MDKDFSRVGIAELKREVASDKKNETKEERDPFKKMAHYDEVFNKVTRALVMLVADDKEPLVNDIDEETKGIVMNEVVTPLHDIIDEPTELHELLPAFAAPYFAHDALTFKRNVIDICRKSINADLLELASGKIEKERRKGAVDELMEHWANVLKNWEAYRLIMEDLFLRSDSKENGYIKSEGKDRDKKIEIGRLVSALEWLATSDPRILGADKGILDKSHFECHPDRATIEKLKINVPHGYIFNFLQNCLSNAMRVGTRNPNNYKLRLSIVYDANKNELSFSLSDNGCGMTDEQVKYIYKEGVSFNADAGGKGLGLAHAKVRAACFGGEVRESTSDNKDFSKKDFVTTFTVTAKVIS